MPARARATVRSSSRRAQLHDKGHLAGGEILADADGGDQGQRHQYIRLDVKGGDQPDDGFQDDGNAA